MQNYGNAARSSTRVSTSQTDPVTGRGQSWNAATNADLLFRLSPSVHPGSTWMASRDAERRGSGHRGAVW